MYAMYQPLRVFFIIGSLFVAIGLLPVLRFTYAYFANGGAGHIQSLVLGGVFIMMGSLAYLVGLVADLISSNRQIMEVTLEKVRDIELREDFPVESNLLAGYETKHNKEKVSLGIVKN